MSTKLLGCLYFTKESVKSLKKLKNDFFKKIYTFLNKILPFRHSQWQTVKRDRNARKLQEINKYNVY